MNGCAQRHHGSSSPAGLVEPDDANASSSQLRHPHNFRHPHNRASPALSKVREVVDRSDGSIEESG